MTEESHPPSPHDSPSDPDHGAPVADPWRVPVSFWIWLAMLLLTYAVPQISNWEGRGAKIVKTSSVASSSGSLQELFQAEYLTRLALSPDLSRSVAASEKAGGKAESFSVSATNTYRKLASEKKGVASARKVLVLEHLEKKPLDDVFLTGVLARNLAARGEKPGAVGAEIALWRSLYGKDAAKEFDRRDMSVVLQRVRGLNLGILEQQALADVYSVAGQTKEAERIEKALQTKVTSEILRLFLLILLLVCGGLAGIGFLILFLTTSANKKWNNVGRIRRVPSDSVEGNPALLPFGSLVDVFVAYLAIARGVGLLAGMLPGLDSVPPVYLSASVYVGTGVLAALYLLAKAKAERWDLPSLGLRTAGWKDILYGVAGYCAALPLVFLLGALNNAVFKKNESSLAPNPVIPMIAGEGSDIGRFVLFCLVALAAPLFEELFFRGVLYSALKTRFSTVLAVVISAACFAIVHPMGDWLPIFGLGCVLATVREMRQSLVPGIVLHFCQNALSFAMMSSLFGR